MAKCIVVFFCLSWWMRKSNSTNATAVSLQLAACLSFIDMFPLLSLLYCYKVSLNNSIVNYHYLSIVSDLCKLRHSFMTVEKENMFVRDSYGKSNKMPQCIKIYFIFIWSSTCFGQHTAHHQEPKTALAASGFCIRGRLLDVQLLDAVRPSTRPDSVQQLHVQQPSTYAKTRGC